MSISTYADYKAKAAAPWLEITQQKVNFAALGQFFYSSWLLAADAGAAPTTAAVPTRTTVGALGYPILYNSAGTARIARIETNCPQPFVTWWLCDRVGHQGGLSATDATAQTTNLPTAALTRATDGIGVMIGLEVYTQIGATNTTVTASYTNEGSTAGRTTPLVQFGGTNYRELNRMIPLPLQSGDFGVKSVESVTITATTGTAGNFGVTLFKPLFPFCNLAGTLINPVWDGILSVGGTIPEQPDDMCGFWVSGQSSTGTGDTTFKISVIED